jgi:hypothetical protein
MAVQSDTTDPRYPAVLPLLALGHVGLLLCLFLIPCSCVLGATVQKIHGENMDKRPYDHSSTCMQILNI